jgi:hypothetical protein
MEYRSMPALGPRDSVSAGQIAAAVELVQARIKGGSRQTCERHPIDDLAIVSVSWRFPS